MGAATAALVDGTSVTAVASGAEAHTPVDIAAIPLQVAAASAPGASFDAPAPVLVRTLAVEAPAFDAEPAATPIVVRAPEAAVRTELPRPRNLPDLPPVQLSLPADSGLELVETRTHAPEPNVEQEAPRPKRTRPPRVVIEDAPLQLVETHHEESDKPPA